MVVFYWSRSRVLWKIHSWNFEEVYGIQAILRDANDECRIYHSQHSLCKQHDSPSCDVHAYPPGHNWDIVVVASAPNMSCIFVVVITISPHFDRHEYEATTSKHSKHRKQRLRGIIKSTQTKSIYYCNNIQLIALWQNHSLYIMHLVSPCTLPCKNHPSCHYLTSMPGTKISVVCKNK